METTDTVSKLDYVHCFTLNGKGNRCGGRRQGDSPYCGTHAAQAKRGKQLALVADYEFWQWQAQLDLPWWATPGAAELAELEGDNERKAAEAAGTIGVQS